MGVNKTVFPSLPEREHFQHLKTRWGDRYKLYANLPFLTVFNIDDLFDLTAPTQPAPISLGKADLDRLKKTSIDYTLCSGDDAPLLCIEFDGMQQGTNIGTQYVAVSDTSPWRREILGLKLKVAHGSFFPFFVMSSSQFVYFDRNDKLAMVDCVIGSVLANMETRKRIAKGFSPEDVGIDQDTFDQMPESEKHELIQDWVIGIEVDAEVAHNPLVEMIGQIRESLGAQNMSLKFIDHPSIAGISDPLERARAVDSVPEIGAQALVRLPDGRQFSGSVWVPNFNTPGYSPFSFIMELAEYAALKKAQRKIAKLSRKRTRSAPHVESPQEGGA